MFRRLMDPAELLGLPDKCEEFLEHGVARCLAFNAHGTLLAAGGASGEVVLWDYETRSVARVLPPQGPAAVTAVAWTPSGRRLVAGAADGLLVVWDVLAAEPRATVSLGPAAITQLCMHAKLPGRLLVSCSAGPAQLLSLAALAAGGGSTATAVSTRPLETLSLPAFVVEGEGKSSGILQLAPDATPPESPAGGSSRKQQQQAQAQAASNGSEGSGSGRSAEPGQQAVVSACGRLLFTATRGTLAVLRLSDQAILDVVKVPGIKRVVGLSQDLRGSYLLVATQDTHVRLFSVQLPADTPLEQLPSFSLDDVKAAAAALPRSKPGAALSLLHDSRPPAKQARQQEAQPLRRPLLELRLDWTDAVDNRKWSCACLSPDGEHAVAGVLSKKDHLIYSWSTTMVTAEQAIETKAEPVVGLAWHPAPHPMQLLALGTSGRIFIYTKVWKENWSAFAPDFEELEVNREYVERECEFDVEETEQAQEHKQGGDTDMVDAADRQQQEQQEQAEQEEVDILTPDPSLEESAAGAAGAEGGEEEPPLLHLPVLLQPNPQLAAAAQVTA